MTPTRKRRLIQVSLILGGVSIATFLVLMALRSQALFFRTPSEVATGQVAADQPFRIGGMVVEDSVKRETGTLKVAFVLTDFAHEVPVEYVGILPDLFREGQGIVAEGQLQADGTYVASTVLAKHDEEYMPVEVADALERAAKDDS